MLDKTTLKLFGKFPREVGTPARRIVHNMKEFEDFITYNNGVVDCYTSLYPTSGEINKISFDTDGKGALSETKQLYKQLISKNFLVIPVVSGKRGFHLHVLLKSQKYEDSKELLLNATLKILEDAFGVDENNELRCKTFDSHTFGDVRQIFRIPNTLRPPENRNFCTYLPPHEFLDMTDVDVAEHMKSSHSYSAWHLYDGYLPTLDDFQKTKVKMKPTAVIVSNNELNITNENQILKNVLRPCLYRHIISSNPKHKVRVAVTVDLLSFFTINEIVSMFSNLGWDDWNNETTRYQVEHCRGLESFSCKTLQKLGVPRECCVD